MNKLKAIAVLEIIIAMLLLSIVVTGSMLLLKEFHITNHNNLKEEIAQLELKNTKLFLAKNLTNTNQLQLSSQTLYFEGNILLKNVSQMSITSTTPYSISLCIGEDVCQTMLLK